MKRILILTILLMSSLAWAGSTTVVVGQAAADDEFEIAGATYYAVAPSGYSYSATQTANYDTRKYETLAAAEAALAASPSTPQVINIIGTWSSADTTQVVIDGTATSEANYILIRTVASTGARHQGAWSTSYYHLALDADGVLTIRDAYVRITGLQVALDIDTAANRAVILSYTVCNGLVVDSCIIRGNVGEATTQGRLFYVLSTAAATVTIKNSILYGAAWAASANANGIVLNDADSTLYAYNNTVYSTYGGIVNTAGSVTATNCAVFGNTDDLVGEITATYCAIDDADEMTGKVDISPGSTESDGWAAAFNGYSTGNFTLKSGSSLKNAGTDVSVDYDIVGSTRHATTPSIGAFE
jgi:hypothetical protein